MVLGRLGASRSRTRESGIKHLVGPERRKWVHNRGKRRLRAKPAVEDVLDDIGRQQGPSQDPGEI